MSRHVEIGRAGDSRRKVRSLGVVAQGERKRIVAKRYPERAAEKRLSPLQARVSSYLDAAYLRGQRRKERQDDPIGADNNLTGMSLLRAFMGTYDFQRFYEIAVKEALKGASWHQDSHRFRGALFQAVVLEHLKKTQLDSSRVLLMGKDVTKFTQLVNPGMTMIEYPYKQPAVDHRYVPDFLALGFNNGRVVVDEYGEISLSSDPEKYMPQLRGFLHERSRLGPLMKDARFRIITPDMGAPLAMQVVPGIEYVDTEPISVTHSDFAYFESEINRSYRKTPESLTLRQIRRQAQVKIGGIRAIGEPQFFRR